MSGGTAAGPLAPLPDWSLPDRRGVAYSCEASTELELAVQVADTVGVARADDPSASGLRYYSVGVISDQQDLVEQAITHLAGRGLRLTYHPIDLDVCGQDPLDPAVLRAVRDRADELDTPWITVDLAMWVKGGEVLVNNLVPMPLIKEAVDWTVPRIQQIQEVVGRPVAVENPPYPFMIGDRDILPLMAEIVERAGCLATFDVGHLYGLRRQQHRPLVQDADDDFCWDRVVEVHIAGNFDRVLASGEVLFEDYHTFTVSPEVWQLAELLVPRAHAARAVMAECELMPPADLIQSVYDIGAALQRWFPSPAPAEPVGR